MATLSVITEPFRAGEFIASEANGFRSREQITVASGAGVLSAGAVLGKQLIGAASAVAGANTGNGVMGAITAGVGAAAGAYSLRITAAAANAGAFEVTDPAGDVVGIGNVGAAFAGGGLSFTLADGAVDFIVGDSFTITVAAGSGKYMAFDPTKTDGTETASAILYDAVDATAADVDATAVVRDAEVNSFVIQWAAGMSAPNIALGTADLATANIHVR